MTRRLPALSEVEGYGLTLEEITIVEQGTNTK